MGVNSPGNVVTRLMNQTLAALSPETEEEITTSVLQLLQLKDERYNGLVLYLGRLLVKLFEEGVAGGTLEEGLTATINIYLKMIDRCVTIESGIIKVLCVSAWDKFPFLIPLLSPSDTVEGTIIPARTWNKIIKNDYQYDVTTGLINGEAPLELISKMKGKRPVTQESNAFVSAVQKMEDNIKNISFRYSYILARYNPESVMALIQRLIVLYRDRYSVGIAIVYSAMALLYVIRDGPKPSKGLISLFDFIIGKMQLNSMDRANLRRVLNQTKLKWGL